MKDRILEIIRNENISNADFANKINVSPATISAILNGRNNPSLDVVTKIHQAYPDISLAWLLDGTGQIYQHKSSDMQPGLFDEIAVNPTDSTHDLEYRKENRGNEPIYPTKNIVKQEIRCVEKTQRKITEIRIFFDDNTYEIFKPDK